MYCCGKFSGQSAFGNQRKAAGLPEYDTYVGMPMTPAAPRVAPKTHLNPLVPGAKVFTIDFVDSEIFTT